MDLEAGTPKASSLPTEKVRFFILDSGKKHLLERSRGTEDCLPLIEQHTSTNTGPGAKLRCLEEGEEAAFSFLARLPNCRMLRPTTLEGSDTPVKVSHALVLDVRYRTSDGIARVMSIYKNITIASVSLPSPSDSNGTQLRASLLVHVHSRLSLAAALRARGSLFDIVKSAQSTLQLRPTTGECSQLGVRAKQKSQQQ